MEEPRAKKKRRYILIHEPFTLSEHLGKILEASKIAVHDKASPVVVDLHCAGADAPLHALKGFNTRTKSRLTSESCP